MGAATTVPIIFQVIDKMTAIYDKMGNSTEKFAARAERAFKKTADAAEKVAKKTAIMGAVLAAPLIMMANAAVGFEDRMADVAKTTQMTGKELLGLGDDILKMSGDTRTPIEGLQKIAEIGGQMGITGREGVLKFTDSVNKFNVALGSDFQGGTEEAARAIGGLNTLFKETRTLDVADSIIRIGSSINALSSKGVKVPEVTEFINRMGQLPDAIKPSVQDVAALGATLTKLGVPAEIAARGVGDILLTATQNAPAFAKQMGMSTQALRDLINTNPVEFLKRFSAGFKGMDASKMGPLLKSLKLGDVGSLKVIGSLSTSMGMLTEFQKISNGEFEKGTSLLNEYNVKNETTAAKIQRAKNQFEALSITIGTELLPIISDLLKVVVPIIKSMMEWVKQNRATVVIILKVTAAIAAFLLVVSGVATIIAGITTALGFLSAAIGVLTAVSWPLVLAILIIAAVIAVIIGAIYLLYKAITLIIEKWNEWGAVAVAVMGLFAPPLALIILMIQSLRRNWDGIIEAFTNGGIIEGLKMIGATMLDAILMPLSQAIELIAKITGADWATGALKQVEDFRKQIGVNVTTEEDGSSRNAPILTTETEKHQAITRLLTEERQKATLDINDNTGNAKLTTDNNLVPINLRSTKRSDF